MAFDGSNTENIRNLATTDLAATFARSPQPHEQTIGAQAFATAVSTIDPQQRSLLTDMIGANPLKADVARVSAQAVGVINSSAGATSENRAHASSLKDGLSNHIENTNQAIRDAQAPVREQLDQAFDSMAGPDGTIRHEGAQYTRDDVRGGFSSATNNISDGLQVAVMLGGSAPGMAGKATASASVVADVREAAGVGNGKLPVKLQNLLSERLAQIHMQDHESGRHPMGAGMKERVAAAAAAATSAQQMANPNQPTALTQLYEEMLQPPENFPEVQEMMNTEHDLEDVLGQHVEAEPDVEAALAVQEQTGLTISLEEAAEVADRILLVSAALTDEVNKMPVRQAVDTTSIAYMLRKRDDENAVPAYEVPKPQVQAQTLTA